MRSCIKHWMKLKTIKKTKTDITLEAISKTREKMSLRKRQPDSTEIIRELREGLDNE